MRTREEIGCARRLHNSSALLFWKRFTTIIILRGEKLTTEKSIGWFVREQRQRSQARKASSVELWANRLSFSKGLRMTKPSILSTARFTAQAESWAGWKPEARRIARRARCSVPARSQ